jgi:hypothetical protein
MIMKYISWGGGLQSTCMAVMSALGDLPKVDAVVHVDPGNEWSLNYKTITWYLKWLNEHGVHAESVKSESSILEKLLSNHTHIPAWTESGAPIRRQCTNHHKLIPLKRKLREIAGYHATNPPHPKPGEFEAWIGFTLDEQERRALSRTKYMVSRWPLIELGMTRDDCTKYLHEHKLPIPPKSACVICPYRRAKGWIAIRDQTPEEFQHAIEIDRAIRDSKPNEDMTADKLYLWQGAIPLEDADLDRVAKEDEQRSKKQGHQIIICDGGSCWT